MTQEEFQNLVLQELKELKTHQEKNEQIIQKLLTNQEIFLAKLERLNINQSPMESIEKFATKDELMIVAHLLNDRLFQQEVEVEKLKLRK